MAQIGNVLDIVKVKTHLAQLKEKGLVREWELPYENLLTRLSAAIFFMTPTNPEHAASIWEEFEAYPNFGYRENNERKLSQLEYRMTFEDPILK